MARVQILSVVIPSHSASKGPGMLTYSKFGNLSPIVIAQNMVPEDWTLVDAGNPGDVYIQHRDTNQWAVAPEIVEGKCVFTTGNINQRSLWTIKEDGDHSTIHLADADSLMWGINNSSSGSGVQVVLRVDESDVKNHWILQEQ
ncbi:hypothetical protein BC629DRAFT_1597065 [Irpex lacteus]|nr:hypothetical protein BC629DRAFT_1597065 [Irpex lacteus]